MFARIPSAERQAASGGAPSSARQARLSLAALPPESFGANPALHTLDPAGLGNFSPLPESFGHLPALNDPSPTRSRTRAS